MPEEVTQGLLQAYMPDFCESVDLVISPSPGMEKVLRQLGVTSRIEVIPNGVELQRFHEARPLSRAEFGFTDQDILLVYAGRIAPEKNLEFLLRSFSGISQTIPNVYLLIIGGGQSRFESEIQTLANELHLSPRIRFTGMIPYDRLPAYLVMCDAFVTASVTEVHPLSVIESMAAGLPVLGIHSPGLSAIRLMTAKQAFFRQKTLLHSQRNLLTYVCTLNYEKKWAWPRVNPRINIPLNGQRTSCSSTIND